MTDDEAVAHAMAATEETRREQRAFVVLMMAEAERAHAAAKFQDMGYEDCETCRQARLRKAFRPSVSELVSG